VYELLGYYVVPVTDYHTAVLLKGTGSNGKTTVLDMIRDVIGARNISTVTLHQMEGSNFAAHQMVGKLLNIEPDMSERKMPSSAKFKAIVGGDPITVEQKYKDPRTVRLYSRLLVSANWFPRSSDSSPGFFRRWLVLPFNKKDFRDEGPDAKNRILPSVLRARVQQEAPGVLRKAVLAFKQVRERGGFTVSARMRDAKAEFRSLTDSVSLWLEENVIVGPELRVQQKQLRSAYHRFCEE
jgi:putative DNA primase/helicase